ncbi:MAG: response regulator [Deltaproteobacteria bacterium]|nr:response regulator [Deltaproteobacteria bacterium]
MDTKENELKGKRILIVDDEPDVLATLEELLSMCEIVKASTFEEARKALETQHFDFAILDIMGVNGYELLEIAQERKATAIMLTAHALSPEDTVKSFKGGAASYVPKDEISNITTFLLDILEAQKKGKKFWWRWMDRMEAYYQQKFGPDWKKGDKEFWERFTYYT